MSCQHAASSPRVGPRRDRSPADEVEPGATRSPFWVTRRLQVRALLLEATAQGEVALEEGVEHPLLLERVDAGAVVVVEAERVVGPGTQQPLEPPFRGRGSDVCVEVTQ